MEIKCPYCNFPDDEEFLGTLWKGIKIKCKNCKKWYSYHIEKGYKKE